MLKSIGYTTKFKKDLAKAKKQGRNLGELAFLIKLLASNLPIPQKYKDHKLVGNFKGRRECHMEPDFLLIYCVNGNDITFERLGSHSDLFK